MPTGRRTTWWWCGRRGTTWPDWTSSSPGRTRCRGWPTRRASCAGTPTSATSDGSPLPASRRADDVRRPGDFEPPSGEYVVKPTVSAAAMDTVRYGPGCGRTAARRARRAAARRRARRDGAAVRPRRRAAGRDVRAVRRRRVQPRRAQGGVLDRGQRCRRRRPGRAARAVTRRAGAGQRRAGRGWPSRCSTRASTCCRGRTARCCWSSS